MKGSVALLVLLVGLLLAAACITPAPTPTTTPVPSPTPSPVKEWALDEVLVDGSTVTAILRVFAGIDVTAALDGRRPDEVRPVLPNIEYFFRNVTPGRHILEVKDIVGYSETAEVVVPAPLPTGGPRQVAVGREFTLKVGEYVEVATAYFIVTFNGITQDSRCPRDVVCVRAGSVTAEIEALASDGWPNTLKLTIGDDGSPTAQFRSYFITATAVHPYPISTTAIDPKEYEVTLIVQTFR